MENKTIYGIRIVGTVCKILLVFIEIHLFDGIISYVNLVVKLDFEIYLRVHIKMSHVLKKLLTNAEKGDNI